MITDDVSKVYDKIVESVRIPQGGTLLIAVTESDLLELVQRRYCDVKLVQLEELDMECFLQQHDLVRMEEKYQRYDAILTMDLLERLEWNRELLVALGFHLKPQGSIYGYFGNITSWQEFLKVYNELYAAWFQDNHLDEINGTNLVWFQSRQFYEQVAWLQSYFTDDVRWQLSYGLQRIEYDIEPLANAGVIFELCQKYKVSGEYLIQLIESVVLEKEKVLQVLVQVGVKGI